MTQDKRTLCVICAWRANCAKRFAMSQDATMHCPDFSEDVSLRRQADAGEEPTNQEQDE